MEYDDINVTITEATDINVAISDEVTINVVLEGSSGGGAGTVFSVNEKVGDVVLTADDIEEGITNKYYTTALFNASFSTKDTDDLAEGATNKYYSDSLFNTSFAAKDTDDLAQGVTNKYYSETLFDSSFSGKTTDELDEGSINKYYSTVLFSTDFSTKDTDDLTEGATNKYYSDTLFDASLGGKDTDDLAEGSTNKYYSDSLFGASLASRTSDNIIEGITNLFFTAARSALYLTVATAAATYLTISGAASIYLTQSSAASTYLKLDASNGPVTEDLRFAKHIAVGPNSSLTAAGSSLYPGSAYKVLIDNEEEFTSMTVPYIMGITNYLSLNPSGAASSYAYGVDNEIAVKSGNSQNIAFITASYNETTHKGTGTIGLATGFEGYVTNYSTGNITNAWSSRTGIVNYGAGVITNAYGFFIGAPVGNITNSYGMYINDTSATGTSKSYNLTSLGVNSKNYFQGFVGIGTLTPAGRLHVVGVTDDEQFIVDAYSTQSSMDNFFKVRNSAGTNLLVVSNSAGGVGVATGSSTVHAKFTIGDDQNYPGPMYVTAISNRIANFGNVFEITSGAGPGWVGQGIQVDGANRTFKFVASPSITLDSVAFVVDTNTNSTIFSNPSSGAKSLFNVGGNANFAATTGSATFAFQIITGTIGQTITGGTPATGITRGLWINPSISTAADWRSLEITPNSGYGIYQSGASAQNYINGKIGVGTASPATLLDVNDDSIRIRTALTPASASATGIQGEVAWDTSFIYVCTATNTWKRAAIATW